jgi:hypothetical protein
MPARRNDKPSALHNVFGRKRDRNKEGSEVAEWMRFDPVDLVKFISTLAACGGAVRFGYTKDGGAFAMGLYYDGESETQYCKPNEDIAAFLAEWQEWADELHPLSHDR